MHLLLTDRMTCPRCGPDFGLILRADEMARRRVSEGVLGCPNCRDTFEIRGGFGDVRAPPRRSEPASRAGEPTAPGGDPESGRIMALLGVTQGPGTIVLVGEPARHAAALSATIQGVHVMAIDPAARSWPDREGVSRLMASPGIPLQSRTARAVAVDGGLGEAMLREATRILAPPGRVVVVQAPPDTRQVLEWERLRILAEEADTVVATFG